MNKKIFGIKVSTILTAIGCVVAAMALWIVANYRLDVTTAAIVTADWLRG